MNALSLSAFIGLEIIDIRFHYASKNEWDLQSFHAYIKLENNLIINIPNFDDAEFTEEALNYFKLEFDTGSAIGEKIKPFISGQRIVDFYFSYNNNEFDLESAFIELSNGYYITERNFGPPGLTNIDLEILDKMQFNEEAKRLISFEVELGSFVENK